MAKIILNLAMSLDGYIADNNNGYEWIKGDDHNLVEIGKEWNHQEFVDSIDHVYLGKSCYDLGMANEFKDKEVYVITHKNLQDYDRVHFIHSDFINQILEVKKTSHKDIYLFGGGQLVDIYLKANVIDEFIIGIIPTILGSGKKLFLDNNPNIPLVLKNTIVKDGIVILIYSKKNEQPVNL